MDESAMKDVLDYLEWKSGLTEEDRLHAWQSIKVMSAIKFAITTVQDESERLATIQKEAAKWVP